VKVLIRKFEQLIMSKSKVSSEERSGFGDVFEGASVGEASASSSYPPQGADQGVGGKHRLQPRSRIAPEGVVRDAPVAEAVFGRGPIGTDRRKFRYDRDMARTKPAISFGATRGDRMDAVEAGDLLQQIHAMFKIERETEDKIAAFDKALFFEHAINGASLLQSGRGVLTVGASVFALAIVKQLLGADQRRFFRAYADETIAVLREVLAGYDAYDFEAAEKHGQVMQIAVERGLQKYPYLIHDSSDAALHISTEERLAVLASKRVVVGASANGVDVVPLRV